jgi:hypothetical protein
VQTSTQRPPRARKQPAAPLSTTASKLIEQIQADARAALLADLSAKDVIIFLHGFDADTKQVRATSEVIEIEDGIGNNIYVSRRRTEPESWRGCSHMAGAWNPSYWYGDHRCIDSNGIQWERNLGTLVCNDFGDLVAVPV